MGLEAVWRKHRVLLVMVPSLALIHWAWFRIQASPVFQPQRAQPRPAPAEEKGSPAKGQ